MKRLEEGVSFALPHYRKARDAEGTLFSFRAPKHETAAEEWIFGFACDGRDLAAQRVANIRGATDKLKGGQQCCAAELAEYETEAAGRSALEAWVALTLAVEALPSLLEAAERVLRAFEAWDMRRSDIAARVRELEEIGQEAAAAARFAETLRPRVTSTGAVAYQMREAFLNTTGKSDRTPPRGGDGRTFPVVGAARPRSPRETGPKVGDARRAGDPARLIENGLAAWFAGKPD